MKTLVFKLFNFAVEIQGTIGIPGMPGFPGGPGLKVSFIFFLHAWKMWFFWGLRCANYQLWIQILQIFRRSSILTDFYRATSAIISSSSKLNYLTHFFCWKSLTGRSSNFTFILCHFRERLDPRESEELQDGRETEETLVLWDHLDHPESRWVSVCHWELD